MSRPAVIEVEIVKTRGSSPRDPGTAMTVSAEETKGTIGGGALEYRAINTARNLLSRDAPELTETIALGPGLGQCCGGAVTLHYRPATRHRRPLGQYTVHPITGHRTHPLHLWLWGAGHVGRAVVRMANRQAFKITWVDDHASRFPPNNWVDSQKIKGLDPVRRIPAADMPLLAGRAPRATHHLIFTYSHEIDLALCAALLGRGVTSIGLIGSDTKRSRFFGRLRDMGLDPAPINCPIGDKSLGKIPESIAQSTLAALLSHGSAGHAAHGKSGEVAG